MNSEIKTIAITGATGFVGSVLTRRLTDCGCEIKALIRPGSFHKRPADSDVRWIKGDLEDTESLRHLICDADAMVHCAGVVRGATMAEFNRVNVEGMARLVKLAVAQRPTPHLLLISSLAAREPHLSFYAASKREGEKVLEKKSDKLFWTIFRPSAIYGPGDRELMPVFQWMKKGLAPILGAGEGRFSLLYVEDLADAIVQWLAGNKGNAGCTYELHDGRPEGYSWHDVIDTVAQLRPGKNMIVVKVPLIVAKLFSKLNLIAARVIGYAPMLTPGKIRELSHSNWVCDNTALNIATGWIPRTQLSDGLQRTLSWNSQLLH